VGRRGRAPRAPTSKPSRPAASIRQASRRLTVALAAAVGAPASALEAARPDLPAQAALLWRAEDPGQETMGPHLDVVADALRADDDVARLFTGGPQA
jgi:hypothetical protein